MRLFSKVQSKIMFLLKEVYIQPDQASLLSKLFELISSLIGWDVAEGGGHPGLVRVNRAE